MKTYVYRRPWGLFKVMIEIYNDDGDLVIAKKMFQGPFFKMFAKRLARRKARMLKLFEILNAASK
jgi:hypothetical protein